MTSEPKDCIKVEAGLLLWAGVRRLAYRHGCDVVEYKIGWLIRGFTITGSVHNLHSCAKELADYLGPQEIE